MFNKKWISGLLAVSIIGGTSSIASASFTDIEHSYAKESIRYLAKEGVLSGLTSERFAPKEKVTRKQFAVVIAKAIGLQPLFLETSSFDDIPSTDWSYGYVEALNQLDVIKGVDGQFHGELPITREDAAVVLYKAIEAGLQPSLSLSSITFTDGTSIASYAREAVDYLSSMGIMQGNQGAFSPKSHVTREQMAVLAKLLFEKYSLLGQSKDWAASPMTVELKVGEQTTVHILREKVSPYTTVYGWDDSFIGSITSSGLFTAKKPGKGFLSVTLGNQTQFILVKITE
ncbi:S-layer homology domain-containing protein [Ammoniphilus sp. YIM 78166]|uniref:S-layer homology domain-containing protein n=1 Tax=Ammoniphilus sp. YIM 78166 TaxID=1644106 RepID=UPI00107026A0|nr:S-layer homology domain-containing protein [Ammoniphilus sp. YIM 78166]